MHNYWRTYGGDVELRKWLGSAAKRKPLTGHHIGAYAQIVTYDFELGGRGYLADRWSYAAGVSYGYSLPVAKRLNIDFSIGLGYMGGEYKEYLPQDGHYVWQSTKRRHWIGQTKAEISLVWLIGRGNTKQDQMTDMKRLIATYALLMVLSMIVVSCEHKELCYSHPHSAKVSVEFEWSQMPAAYSPGGMRVIFYPRNGGEEIVRDFVGEKGGCVEIPSGVYDVVCFNNDTQRVKYNGADGFSSIAATTGVAQVGDVKAFRTPDYLCGGRMVAVEVEVKIGCEQIIVLPVAPMVCRYTYTVRGVKNLQNFSECVAVQRAMCSEYSVGGDNEIQESKADICFAMERNDDVITGWCYTFGAADCDVYKTILYIRTASGKMVKGEYDVTQQINSQKGNLKNVDIVIDTDLDLDKHGGNSGNFGFDPSVDEWGDIESDIIL